MPDTYTSYSTDPSSPALDCYMITPSDSALPKTVRVIEAKSNGNVVVTTKAGSTVTIPVSYGDRISCVCTHVKAATTATVLLGYV